jgi:hypothetical protein
MRCLVALLMTFFITTFLAAQETPSTSDEPKEPQLKISRRAAKKQWKEERKRNFELEKNRRQIRKSNDKRARKQMRQTARKSKRTNDNKREFFLKRWFKRDQINKSNPKKRRKARAK